jgi:hypothetical protein
MKRFLYVLLAMLFVACGLQQTANKKRAEEGTPAEQTIATEQTEQTLEEEQTDEITTPEPSEEAAPEEVIEQIDPNKSIKLIEKELVGLLCELEKSSGNHKAIYACSDKIKERLDFYLRHPQTFEHDMPELKKHMSIEHFPRKDHKIYSYNYYEGGTMGNTYWYFIQYRSKSGEIEYIPFRHDLYFGCGKFKFIEFSYKNKQYYYVEEYKRYDGMSHSYYLAVITIDDGVVNYHTELYPKEINFEPEMERYEAYDENGELVPGGDDRPCYFFRACGTERQNQNVGVEFDPETLTITALDCADTVESYTGATTKRVWKLGN